MDQKLQVLSDALNDFGVCYAKVTDAFNAVVAEFPVAMEAPADPSADLREQVAKIAAALEALIAEKAAPETEDKPATATIIGGPADAHPQEVELPAVQPEEKPFNAALAEPPPPIPVANAEVMATPPTDNTQVSQ